MTLHDFDSFDRSNDPDLQEPPICRHRAGDPDCMCHDAEDEAREALDNANALAYLDEMSGYISDVLETPDPEKITSPEKRSKLDGLEEAIQEIISSMRSDFA